MTMPKFMTNTPDTKSQLAKAKMEADAATNKLYAAEAAHEKAEKNKNVQTTAKKVKESAALVQQTKVAADSAKQLMEQALKTAPNEDHSKVIAAHHEAAGKHEDAKDALNAAKKAHDAATNALKGGKRRKRRRTRKTRRKKRKSKHHRRRKRHTKKHRRSRRKRRSRRR